jgi:hypothetical protein
MSDSTHYLDRNFSTGIWASLTEIWQLRNRLFCHEYNDRNVSRLSCYRVGTMLVGIPASYCDRNLSAGTFAIPTNIYVNRGAVHVTTLNQRRQIGRDTFKQCTTDSLLPPTFWEITIAWAAPTTIQYKGADSLNNTGINFVTKRVSTPTSDSWRMISPPPGQRCAT